MAGSFFLGQAQQPKEIIDEVIGVVGKYPILKSDLQNALIEREQKDLSLDKCETFENLVYRKLLVTQASAIQNWIPN